MRTLSAVALLLVACGSPDGAGSTPRQAPPSLAASGTDQLALRIPTTGGRASVYQYPRMDSTVWTSDAAVPAISRTLAMDAEAGAIAFADAQETARVLDFRLGGISRQLPQRLTGLAADDSWSVYGITQDGAIARVTPNARWENNTAPAVWQLKLSAPAKRIFALPDGSIIVIGARSDTTLVWHLFPPADREGETARIPNASEDVLLMPPGDRLYFAVGSTLVGIQTADLKPTATIRLPFVPQAMAASPSGDRLFLTTEDGRTLAVVDRYQERITETVELPSPVSSLRMDELGRYLLARGATADSIWVIAVGTNRVIGPVRSMWRTDLPAVAPDGRIAVTTGGNVTFVDGETLRARNSVRNGGRDYWLFFQWNGFRPRAAGLDEPVIFEADSADSVAALMATFGDTLTDSLFSPPNAPPKGAAPPPDAPKPRPAGAPGFYAQFHAFTEPPPGAAARADSAARTITAEGRTAHVMRVNTNGRDIYKVVLGPFPTRAEAQRNGQLTKRTNFFVTEEAP